MLFQPSRGDSQTPMTGLNLHGSPGSFLFSHTVGEPATGFYSFSYASDTSRKSSLRIVLSRGSMYLRSDVE